MDPEGTNCAPAPLTGAQRKHLRGLANPLKALVQVGEAGLSDPPLFILSVLRTPQHS